MMASSVSSGEKTLEVLCMWWIRDRSWILNQEGENKEMWTQGRLYDSFLLGCPELDLIIWDYFQCYCWSVWSPSHICWTQLTAAFLSSSLVLRSSALSILPEKQVVFGFWKTLGTNSQSRCQWELFEQNNWRQRLFLSCTFWKLWGGKMCSI